MTHLTESDVEESALAWLHEVGWTVAHGPTLAPGELLAERADFGQVVLEGRLRDALGRLNPDPPAEALDDAFRKLLRPEGSVLEMQNRALHRMLVDGVDAEFGNRDGEIRGAQARVVDFDDAPAKHLAQVPASQYSCSAPGKTTQELWVCYNVARSSSDPIQRDCLAGVCSA